MRELTIEDVEITLECWPEQEPIEGNCSAIDDETDRATEEWIHAQLDSGNDWAWCTAKVTVRWEGFEGTDYLGCCSYPSEKDFRQGGYYDDMVQAALDNLNDEVQRAAAKLAKLS